MRSRITLASVLLVATVLSMAHATPPPSRAVSLNALSAAMQSGEMAKQAESLCGLTRVSGYVIDAKSKDIVVVGKVDPTLPPLNLDDFTVALRNAWHMYTQTRGRVRYYSDPGCSIDPDPRVLGQLRELTSSPLDFTNSDEVKARTAQWREIGRQPQKVRVMGVPFDSNFAKVMVDADYYMKRLVNGSVSLGIDGFRSLTDLHITRIREEMHSKSDSSTPESSMSRFWFSPGDCTYEDGDGFVVLKSCTVKLLTEGEFLTEHGTVSGMGRPDPLAGQFARSFTQKYAEIAAQRPIYKQLQGLFAFAALARLMKDNKADSVAPKAFSYILNAHRVAPTPVNRAVNGLTDVRTIDEQVDSPQGRQSMSLIESTCGGVSMSVRPKRVGRARSRPATPRTNSVSVPANVAGATKSTKTPRTTRIAKAVGLKHAVLSSKKSRNALSWDVPAQLD